MKHRLLLALLLCFIWLSGEVVQIGTGTVLSQGLPLEPVAHYSYSQQLFKAAEIGSGGIISALGFQYNVTSSYFFSGNRQWKIWLGHTPRTSMNTGWMPLDSLTLVYDGLLTESDFTAGLPGSGWLQIALNNNFNYNGNANLVVAVDENSAEWGSNADDFYTAANAAIVAVQFQSASINPDPAAPPTTGFNLKSYRSNLRIEIQALHYTPVFPNPANGASGVAIDGNFSWTSLCESFSIKLGTHPDSLQTVASNLSASVWQFETPLNYYQQYFWQVIGLHDGQFYPSAVWNFVSCSEAISPPQQLSGFFNGSTAVLNWQTPLEGSVHYYKVYRNSAYLGNSAVLHYEDSAVQAGQSYFYYVTAISHSGSESGASNLVSVTIPEEPPEALVYQGFEACASFALEIANWQNLDLDGSLTWGWENVNYPHEGEAIAWQCFAPAETTPPLTGYTPYLGTKMLLAMSSLSPPNNDWLISPAIHLGQDPLLSFYARSAVSDFGLERLRVLISTTDALPASFTALNSGGYLSVPVAWTPYSYNLASYQNQRVFLALQCVSVDAFALFLDEIKLYSTGGWVSISDNYIPLPAFSSFPNPSSNGFSLENKSGEPFSIEIYNLKGQCLFMGKGMQQFNSEQIGGKLASGVYLLRISQSNKTWLLKQAVLK